MLLSLTPLIGRLHPVLVHLPIGVLLTGILLQWLYGKGSHGVSLAVIKIVFLVGTVCAWLSCLTGYLLSDGGDYETGLVSWHMWLGLSVAFIASLICCKIVLQQTDGLYKVLSIGLPVLILVTGHLGGSLTHGTDYLTAALQTETGLNYPAHAPITNIQEAKIYSDIIQPIFQKECYGCHSSKRQKGKLRLDDSARIMAGGKSGPALIPFRPAASELLKRLLLPTDNEHHMPKEKPSLKEDQVSVISWWIAQGADFNKKVKAFEQPPKVRTSLLALQNNNPQGSQSDSLVPLTFVEPGDPASIKALKDKGAAIMPVAQNSHYLMADFINTTQLQDRDLALLLPLQKQLIWLKLGNITIGDNSMPLIARCQALTSLQLNNTLLTDKGVAALQSLHELQSLNLVGTAVSAQGVLSLSSLKKLRNLYLFGTRVEKKDWEMLKKHFPKTSLDSGGYQVPLIGSDTVILKAPQPH